MQKSHIQTRFALGQIVATRGALDTMAKTGHNSASFLQRHVSGDRGALCLSSHR